MCNLIDKPYSVYEESVSAILEKHIPLENHSFGNGLTRRSENCVRDSLGCGCRLGKEKRRETLTADARMTVETILNIKEKQ